MTLSVEYLKCKNERFHKDCYWASRNLRYPDSQLSLLTSRIKREVMKTNVAYRVIHDSMGLVTTIKRGHDGVLFVSSDNAVLKALQPTRLPSTRSSSNRYRDTRQSRYEEWTDAGFLPFEAREYSRQYSLQEMRASPSLQSLIRWRRLYVANLRYRGYTDDQIERAITALYQRNAWYKGIEGGYEPSKQIEYFKSR